MMDIRLQVFLVLCVGLGASSGDKLWSYTGTSGPKSWHELFPEACGGTAQSPIDVKMEQTKYNPNLKDFAIWYDPPKPNSRMIFKNNGHSVQVDLEGDFFVTNGGLENVFRAVQFHFHWGHKSHHGSEHLFDGKAGPLEMHLVTFNEDKYADIGEAATESDGLAVLGVMFEITDEDNPAFNKIVQALKYIRNPELRDKVELPLLSLRSLLPNDISRYYRYQGSLTTPGCFESVTWTVFQQKQKISRTQMEEFRKVLQKRRHHHHKKQEQEQPATSEEKKEHNAKTVLNELGIKGDTLQEENLVDQVNKKSDSLSHGGVQAALEGGMGHKTGQTATVEDESERRVIVNNFRPVQPINEREVYRSFRLRDVYYTEFEADPKFHVDVQETGSSRDPGHSHSHGDGGHDGAGSLKVSVTVLVASLVCVFRGISSYM